MSKSRLVTLVGAGGVGKTELGIAAAREQRVRFDDIRFVALSSAQHSSSIIAAMTQALGIKQPLGSANSETIAEAIGERSMLIVVDNCEHVVDDVARICEPLLQNTANLRILATSREPLCIPQEQVYNVPALDVPSFDAACADILKCSAVQTFLSYARALEPRFPTDTDSVAMFGTICRKLNGLPLALQLAATQATAVGTRVLCDNLDDFAFMSNAWSPTAPQHQQTLQAVFDWSYHLLTNHERMVLRRIAPFHKRFTLAAACEVAVSRDCSVNDIVKGAAGLVSKSLLSIHTTASTVEYYLLAANRSCALRKLAESGEANQIEAMHERYRRADGNNDSKLDIADRFRHELIASED